jgi:hypothetical protein
VRLYENAGEDSTKLHATMFEDAGEKEKAVKQ